MTDPLRREAEELIFEIAKVDGLDEDVITGMIVKRFKVQRVAECEAIDGHIREMYKCDRRYQVDVTKLLNWLEQRDIELRT